MSKKELLEKVVKEEKITKEQVAEALSVPAEIEPLIYCGPTIRNGELQQFAVFMGKLPQHIEKLTEEEIAIKELLVPIKDLASVRSNIHKRGTREHLLFEKALGYARGGNK